MRMAFAKGLEEIVKMITTHAEMPLGLQLTIPLPRRERMKVRVSLPAKRGNLIWASRSSWATGLLQVLLEGSAVEGDLLKVI